MYYLYLKTHNITGLNYLGKTVQDPYTYRGSGKYWTRHLQQHGNDVSTTVLAECSTIEEFISISIYYSKLYDVVNSSEFANLIEEVGDGGDTSQSENYKKYYNNPDNKEKFIERGRKSRITAKIRGTDLIREQKFKETVNSDEWKNTKGLEKVKKCNEVRDHKAAGIKVSQTKQSTEWKETIGKESIRKRVESTDWNAVAVGISKTRNDKLWKETIGAAAAKKLSDTMLSPEWKETTGKELIRKRTETILSDEWKKDNYITCDHCGKFLDKMNYKKWHGDNCKQKKDKNGY